MTSAQTRTIGFGFLLVAIAFCVQWQGANGGDKLWLMMLSHMWLSGKALYSTLFQPNLPLITWFYVVPLWLSEHSGADAFHLLVFLTLIYCCTSFYFSAKLIARHPEFSGNRYKQWQHALLLAFTFIVWTNPAFFGDREHLIVIGFFPYLLRFMPSLASIALPRWQRVSIALLAAFSLCIRPQALLFFALVQILNMQQTRSKQIVISLENTIIYLSGALYLLAINSFTTDYFSVVLPMVAATYAETNQGITRVLPYCTSVFMLGITLAEFRLRHTTPYRRDIIYLLGLCLGGFLYALSNNGWPYTFYPLQSLILYSCAWVLWEFQFLLKRAEASGEPVKSFRFGRSACVLNLGFNTLLVFAIYSVVLLPASYQKELVKSSRIDAEVIALVKDSGAHSFGLMSSSRSVWPEIVYKTPAMLETKFNHLWMLTKFLNADAAFTEKYKWIPDYVARAYAADLNTTKPALMLVDASDEFYLSGKKLDLVAYFSTYPAFSESWKHYRLLKVINYCEDPVVKDRIHKGLCRYDVYERYAP